MHTVESILRSKKDKPKNIIEPSAFVIEALQKLIEVNRSYLIVMENNEFKGIFSERDYTRKLVLQGRSSRDTKVSDVMTTDDLPRVSLSTTAKECMHLVNDSGGRYLAAYDGNDFLGIITVHDLLQEVLTDKQEVFDSYLTNYLLENDQGGKFF